MWNLYQQTEKKINIFKIIRKSAYVLCAKFVVIYVKNVWIGKTAMGKISYSTADNNRFDSRNIVKVLICIHNGHISICRKDVYGMIYFVIRGIVFLMNIVNVNIFIKAIK